MKPAAFDYIAVKSVAEALAALKAGGEDARVIAGGQSLVPMMNLRLAQPSCLVDINGLTELATVTLEGDELVIGALMRHHDLARHPLVKLHCPILAAAAETIGYYAIRQRGTLGGSLAQADPAAQLPLMAVLLKAQIVLQSAEGTRLVEAIDFFQSVFTTALDENEIITQMRVPLSPLHQQWGYALFQAVAGDYAMAAAAAELKLTPEGLVQQLDLALGSVGPVPLRIDTAKAIGMRPSPQALEAFARESAEALEEVEDGKIDMDYRRDLVVEMIMQAITEAMTRGGAA